MRLPLDLGPITEGLRSISETMRTIRDSVALLPDVAETLVEIQKGVERMGDEVHRMRVGVDVLGDEVRGMRAAVEPLEAQLDMVGDQVQHLGPKLEEVSLAIHPLRRATTKLGRRRAANGAELIATEDEAAAPDPEPKADQTSSTENVSHADGSPSE